MFFLLPPFTNHFFLFKLWISMQAQPEKIKISVFWIDNIILGKSNLLRIWGFRISFTPTPLRIYLAPIEEMIQLIPQSRMYRNCEE